MFAILRRLIGGRKVRHPSASAVESARGDARAQAAQRRMTSRDRHPHVENNVNFERRFEASDREAAGTAALNDSDLRSDGSSDFSRIDLHRHDGGDTEVLRYPHTPDFKGGPVHEETPGEKRQKRHERRMKRKAS